MADRYFAYRAMQYSDDLYLEQGQVMQLAGLKKDAKLVAGGLLVPLQAQIEVVTCVTCGHEFTKQKHLKAHIKRAHTSQEPHAFVGSEAHEVVVARG